MENIPKRTYLLRNNYVLFSGGETGISTGMKPSSEYVENRIAHDQ